MQLHTPYHEAHQKLEDLGWTLKSIRLTNGLYVAKGEGPSGKKSERVGQSPELALAALVLSAQRHNTIRKKAAIVSVAAWQHDFSKHREGIARAYAEAPAFDNKAVPAWRALADESRKQADAIRKQIKVDVTDKPEPYASHHEMRHDVHHKKRYQVSRASADHPVWTPEEVQDFRIVNDVIGHAQSGADYTFEGVTKAFNNHAPHLTPAAREALFVETIGRAAYKHTYPGHGPNKVVLMSDFLNDAHQAEGEHVSIPHGSTPDAQEGVAEVIQKLPEHMTAHAKEVFEEQLAKGKPLTAAREAAAGYLKLLKLGKAADETATGFMVEHLAASIKPKRMCGHAACWCTHLAKLVVGADVDALFKRALETFPGRADVQQWSQKLMDAGWRAGAQGDLLLSESPLQHLIMYFQSFNPEAYKLLDWTYNKIKKGEISFPSRDLRMFGGPDEWRRLFPAWTPHSALMTHARDIVNQAGALMIELKAKNRLPRGFDVNRMSFPELESWVAEEHEKKVGEGWMERPVAYTDEQTGYTVEEVNTREDLAREGKLMQHCVGGYYGSGTQIYSLRDPNGKPHVTVEIQKRANGKWDILQTQAPSDSVPKQEYQDMLARWYVSLEEGGIEVEDREEREPDTIYEDQDPIDITTVDGLLQYYHTLQSEPYVFGDDEDPEMNDDGDYVYQNPVFLEGGPQDLRDEGLDYLLRLIETKDADRAQTGQTEEAQEVAQALYAAAHHFEQAAEYGYGGYMEWPYDIGRQRYDRDRSYADLFLKGLAAEMQELLDEHRGVLTPSLESDIDPNDHLFDPADYNQSLAEQFVGYFEALTKLPGQYDKPNPARWENGDRNYYAPHNYNRKPGDEKYQEYDKALQEEGMMAQGQPRVQFLNMPVGDNGNTAQFPQWFAEQGMHDIENFPTDPHVEVPSWQRIDSPAEQYERDLRRQRSRERYEAEQAQRQGKTAAEAPAYRFVYYNTGLNIQPWHHNLRFRDLRHQLLKDFNLDPHVFEDTHNEWAAGDVFRDGYGEYRIDLQNLAERDIQLEATTAVMGWLADHDVPDWEPVE